MTGKLQNAIDEKRAEQKNAKIESGNSSTEIHQLKFINWLLIYLLINVLFTILTIVIRHRKDV